MLNKTEKKTPVSVPLPIRKVNGLYSGLRPDLHPSLVEIRPAVFTESCLQTNKSTKKMDRGQKHHNLREGNNWNMRKRKESIEVEWNNYLTSKLHIELIAWNKNTVGKYNRLKASPPFLFVHHTYLPPISIKSTDQQGQFGRRHHVLDK